jgi:hypothetical protein
MSKIGTQEFIQEQIRKNRDDPYRKAFFMAVSTNEETMKHIDDLYDFEAEGIKPEGLKAHWQTGMSLQATTLAFNLFNGYVEDGAVACTYATPYQLIARDAGIRAKQFEAINALFGG